MHSIDPNPSESDRNITRTFRRQIMIAISSRFRFLPGVALLCGAAFLAGCGGPPPVTTTTTTERVVTTPVIPPPVVSTTTEQYRIQH
jgi:uncharacterized lipoprotein YajG